MRHDGRKSDEQRRLTIKRRFTRSAPGSVLIQAGRSTVLCTADISEQVPQWLVGQGRGWITAEYGMLPGSTSPRKQRDRGPRSDGRSMEIQRLIGRSLRAIADLDALGERTITVDCDVLEADGGTRGLSITGAWIAMVDAILALKGTGKKGTGYPLGAERSEAPVPFFLKDSVAAVSVGLVDGQAILDLDYAEDVAAKVDMNVVMTGSGRFVEIQGTGEQATFDDADLKHLLSLARRGIAQLTALQRKTLGKRWPFE
jgi:ribonuclease PH